VKKKQKWDKKMKSEIWRRDIKRRSMKSEIKEERQK